jgi:hypothetical protein
MFTLRNIDWKKVGLIGGFLLICILIGVGIYTLFFKPVVTPIGEKIDEIEITQLPGVEPGTQPGITTGDKPGDYVYDLTSKEDEAEKKSVIKIPGPTDEKIDEVAKGGITRVNTIDFEKTSKITLSNNGNDLISYNPDTGKFYELKTDGTKTPLTDKVFKQVESVDWAPSKTEAILEFPDGTNIYYDFEKDKQISLPKDWTDFTFNQSSSQIAFKDLPNNEDFRFLASANPDGSNQKYLEYIGDEARNFITDWSPNNKMVAQFKNGKDGEHSTIYFLGQYDERFKSITVNGYGVETKWVPDGSKLVYSAHNMHSDHKPTLHIVDASGDNVGKNHYDLKLHTWVDKCTFQGKTTMYCAVPKEMPYGAGLVPRLTDDIGDYIYKVDLKTGVKSFVAEPEYDYNIEEMQVSDDGSSLFFTGKDGYGINEIKLK